VTKKEPQAESGNAGPARLEPAALFVNRELSWLEFNQRVLNEGTDPEVPLLERLKFLAIVGSNLDEFLMIRVAGLRQQVDAGVTGRCMAGMTPSRQLEAVTRRIRLMVAAHAAAIRQVLGQLEQHGLFLRQLAQLDERRRRALDERFRNEILPVLSPLAVDELDPFPHLPGSSLNVGAVLERLVAPAEPADAGPDAVARPESPAFRLGVVPLPANLGRFIRVSGDKALELVKLEDVVAHNLPALFPGHRVVDSSVFRLVRDADVVIDDDDVSDLLSTVEDAVRQRRRRAVVQLATGPRPHPALRNWLLRWCAVTEDMVVEIDGVIGASALMELALRPGFEALRYEDWPPQEPVTLVGEDDIFAALRRRDVMVSLPYESFEPVVRLAEAAAADPNVLAIKQTLYRTESGSPLVAALARAAESGKQVTVLVELKARFDEAKNADWARQLEDAGCHVIYGIAGLKTHGKALLVVRREAGRIRRYLHLSTGNYNAKTARIYSDVGYMTCDPQLCTDAAAFFNLLTGYSQAVEWRHFAISPKGIRRRLEELIRREADSSTPDQPGLIMGKMNSLHDKGMCLALHAASRAGVRILLNVRGICGLRPGIKGVSDNIEVVSIVDRFLEHSRIFYFRNGGHEEVYLSSADWMTRNLDKRLEILFPVLDPDLRRRAIDELTLYFADNVKACRLGPDGAWKKKSGRGKRLRAQEELHRRAVEAHQALAHQEPQFKPLTRPE
jgi:polyphosphate kinase